MNEIHCRNEFWFENSHLLAVAIMFHMLSNCMECLFMPISCYIGSCGFIWQASVALKNHVTSSERTLCPDNCFTLERTWETRELGSGDWYFPPHFGRRKIPLRTLVTIKWETCINTCSFVFLYDCQALKYTGHQIESHAFCSKTKKRQPIRCSGHRHKTSWCSGPRHGQLGNPAAEDWLIRAAQVGARPRRQTCNVPWAMMGDGASLWGTIRATAQTREARETIPDWALVGTRW